MKSLFSNLNKLVHFLTSFPLSIVIFLGTIVYAQTLFFDLTYLDDNALLLDRNWLLKDFLNLPRLFFEPDLLSEVFYRPVLGLSFMLDTQWGGTSPVMFHLTNLVIHLTGAVLFFVFLQRLGYGRSLAGAVTLIFTVHPVLTQAVAWIPGRTDSLLAVFILISFLCFHNYLMNSRKREFILHLIFLSLALLTKETALVLPVLCLAFYFLIRLSVNPRARDNPVPPITKAGAGSPGSSIFKRTPSRLQWGVLTFSWGSILLGWYFLRRWVLRDSPTVSFAEVIQSVSSNAPALVAYLGKMIFPVNVSVLPVLPDLPLVYGWTALVMIGLALVFSKNSRGNYILFGLLWMLIFLLPSLVLSFLKHEYRVYLPIMGLFIMILESDVIRWIARRRMRLIIFTGLIALLFSAKTISYSRDFRDRLTFWHKAVLTSPHSPLAHRNLGAMYFLDGNWDQAQEAFKKSLALNSQEPMVHNNLALVYMNKKRYAEAEREFLKEIEYYPRYDNAYYNLGLLYYYQGRRKETEMMWQKTLAVNPDFILALRDLAAFYVQQNDREKASYYIRELQKRGLDVP